MKKTLSEIADILYRKNVNYGTHFIDPSKPNPNGDEKPPKDLYIKIPKSNNEKVNRTNLELVLSPIYTYVLYLENKTYKKGYTLIPIATTNKIMLAIFGNKMKISRTIDKMIEMNIIVVEDPTSAFDKGKNSHCRIYKFYWENAEKLIEFCKKNNIEPKEINSSKLDEEFEDQFDDDYEDRYDNYGEESEESDESGEATEQEKDEDLFDAEAYARTYKRKKDVRFTSGVRFNKPNELSRAQFERVLVKCLETNYSYLKEYYQTCNEINEKFYKDDEDLKIRLRIKFRWTKKNTITKIKLRGCCALNNYKKCDRETIKEKYGFDKEYDITSSVPRITYLLNKKEWKDQNYDFYSEIYKKMYNKYPTHEEREAIKKLHMRAYFEKSDETLIRNALRKMRLEGIVLSKKEEEDFKDKLIKLRKAVIEVEGGKLYGNYIFVAETFVYLDVLHLMLIFGCKAWLLFDCFYYKEADVKGKYKWKIDDLLKFSAKKFIC